MSDAERIRDLERQVAKLIEARELAAAASATLREESLAHQARCKELESRNRLLEEMGAECAQDWQKIERLVARVGEIESERDQARAAYDRMTETAKNAQSQIARLETALRKISTKGREHPDPYVPGSWFAETAEHALEPDK